MFKIVLSCSGVPVDAGEQGALDIEEEFRNRPWQRNFSCTWEESKLVLSSENDVDSTGMALMDEFSDAISACVAGNFDSEIDVVRVVEVETNAT